mmetsp:Transcript_11791/g.35796  ORF Transcript_11791/g.35796 Transcript_11791/m.35796 type:complete len:205 (-) Transcript_11791:140-754(-)
MDDVQRVVRGAVIVQEEVLHADEEVPLHPRLQPAPLVLDARAHAKPVPLLANAISISSSTRCRRSISNHVGSSPQGERRYHYHHQCAGDGPGMGCAAAAPHLTRLSPPGSPPQWPWQCYPRAIRSAPKGYPAGRGAGEPPPPSRRGCAAPLPRLSAAGAAPTRRARAPNQIHANQARSIIIRARPGGRCRSLGVRVRGLREGSG